MDDVGVDGFCFEDDEMGLRKMDCCGVLLEEELLKFVEVGDVWLVMFFLFCLLMGGNVYLGWVV